MDLTFFSSSSSSKKVESEGGASAAKKDSKRKRESSVSEEVEVKSPPPSPADEEEDDGVQVQDELSLLVCFSTPSGIYEVTGKQRDGFTKCRGKDHKIIADSSASQLAGTEGTEPVNVCVVSWPC